MTAKAAGPSSASRAHWTAIGGSARLVERRRAASLRELVVVDRGIVGRGEEGVDLLAHRIELRARRLVEAERLLELPGAQHQVGAEQRAVGE